MTAAELEQLLGGCVDGDDQAQARFYNEFAGLVERAVKRKLARVTGQAPLESDVEDIRHEVFHSLFRDDCNRLRRIQKPQAITAWLMTVAGNHAIDHIRAASRRTQIHAAAAAETSEGSRTTPAEDAMNNELTDHVNRCLAELSDQDRLVLDLFFVQGLKYAEIAEVMGVEYQHRVGPASPGQEPSPPVAGGGSP